MAWGLITYQDAARREDLLDVIGDVSPDETPLMTLFGTSTARGTYHEWLTYSVSRPSTVSSTIEGADASFSDLTQPSRTGNVTHIVTQPIQVSRTERKVNVAGMGDPYTFQKADALRQLKMKMEYIILNSTTASGSSGVARKMNGIDAFITSIVTNRNSGTSYSEQELNDMASDAYSAVRADKVFDMLLCTVKIKQAITGFGGNSTRYINAESKRLTKDILVYDSAVGSHRIMHHRDVRNDAGSTTVYGLREDLHRVAYFDQPEFEELSKVGDADRGQWVTEFTLEVQNEKADLKRTGYAQNG
jgi:hypothetical protein